ncbi:MAG: hypothetical protein JXA74_17295 [Anaerolineae bacterium]|nr:hypothetical protein [Anaerolineae bacterium]
MAETYTYTARSAEKPERVVTFTLRGSRMSVGVGAPLEQVEQMIGMARGEGIEEQIEQGAESEAETHEAAAPELWLRPLAFSLIERGSRPVHVDDVAVEADDDWLQVKAWIRVGGLRLAPVTLIDGPVDNPVAARDFAQEVHERKTATGPNVFALFDYWATWFVAGIVALGLFQRWQRKGGNGAGDSQP